MKSFILTCVYITLLLENKNWCIYLHSSILVVNGGSHGKNMLGNYRNIVIVNKHSNYVYDVTIAGHK